MRQLNNSKMMKSFFAIILKPWERLRAIIKKLHGTFEKPLGLNGKVALICKEQRYFLQ